MVLPDDRTAVDKIAPQHAHDCEEDTGSICSSQCSDILYEPDCFVWVSDDDYESENPESESDDEELIKRPQLDQPSSPFLNLPLEIRTEIYNYFRRPKVEDMRKTRDSLMMVSRQVAAECSPIFYREMKFFMHSSHFTGRDTKSVESNAKDFPEHFLDHLPDYKLHNIPKLEYCMCEARHLGKAHASRHLRVLRRVFLKYSGILTSLEEVVIITPHELDFEELLAGEQPLENADANEMWKQVCLIEPQWKAVEDALIQDGCPLHDWKITRQMATDDEKFYSKVSSSDDIGMCDDDFYGWPDVLYITSTYSKSKNDQTTAPKESVQNATVETI
ncbi:hypothetical protein RBB50_007425 [Rhinocladiella similis]